MKRLLLLLLVLNLAAHGYSQDSLHRPMQDSVQVLVDSTKRASPPAAQPFDDDGPMLALILLLGIVGLLAALTLGIIACLILFGIAILLTLGGILSFSVIMGLYKGSLKTSIRWAVYLLFACAGAGMGIVSYFLYLLLRKLHLHISAPLLASGAAGLVGGLICGAVFLFLLRKTYEYLQKRLAARFIR